MKHIKTSILLFVLFLGASHEAQAQGTDGIAWTEISASHDLPDGVKLFSGRRESPALDIWYYEVDLNQPGVAIIPYLAKGGTESISDFSTRKNVYGAINGGYFGSGSSFSALVQPGEVLAQNIASVTRNGSTYPTLRSFFGIGKDGELSIDWIYHFSNLPEGVHRYEAPLGYTSDTSPPLPAPTSAQGVSMTNLLMGIGGGPTLVKGDSVRVTYFEEVFWGSGVGLTNRDPRTAVGFTEDNRVIMVVADGRHDGSEGVSLPELAQIMIDLGCTEAMNLDGGGSTQMTAGSTLINSPEGGTFQRPVATFLAITHPDSIPETKEPDLEYILDTEYAQTEIVGSWGETANPGFFGQSKSRITLGGDGSNQVIYSPELPKAGAYLLSGWWVASSNRSKRSAYIVQHANGVDTLYADQSTNNAKWVDLGTFTFTGTSSDKVIISNMGGDASSYVVADAIRFSSTGGETGTSVEMTDELGPDGFRITKAWPNPFNPSVQLTFEMRAAGVARLTAFNALGQQVGILFDGSARAGEHTVTWNAESLPSGTYLVRLDIVGGAGAQIGFSNRLVTLIK